MPTRLVVFDLDGTLVDSSRDLTTAINQALAQLAPGTPALDLATVRGMIGEGARYLVSRALERTGLSLSVDAVLPTYLAFYRGCLLDTTRAYPGVPELLERLSGRRLAVLTNKPGDLSRAVLAGLGLAHRFVRVYGAGDLPTRKPDPEGLRRLIAENGVAARETTMLGDSAIDVRTARAAGVRSIGAAWGLDPDGLRREPPDTLIHSPSELPPLLEQ